MPTQCTDAGKAFDLTGRFGILIRTFVDIQAAAGAINQGGLESDLLLLADFTPQAGGAQLGVQVCDLTLPPVPVSGARPLLFQLDPSLLESLGTLPASLVTSGSSTCAGVSQSSPIVILLGAKVHAATDQLPTFDVQAGTYPACGGSLMPCSAAPAPDSGSCVCDQDDDGKLGATLGLMNAPGFPGLEKGYVALRTTVSLTGQVFSSDLLSGTANTTLEQQILGCENNGADCDSSTLGLVQQVAPKIMQSDASQKCDLLSLFTAKRVPGTTDCTALKSMKGSLFGQ